MMCNKSFGVGFSAIVLAGAFGLAATAANAESVMKFAATDWKAAKAAGTTNGQTWNGIPQDLRGAEERRRRRLAAATPAPAAAPAPAPAALLRRPAAPAPAVTPPPRPRRRPSRRRPRWPPPPPPALASSRPRPRRRRIARATPSSGSTPSRTSTTSPATRATARPSRAPICAKPTPRRQATSPRRAKAAEGLISVADGRPRRPPISRAASPTGRSGVFVLAEAPMPQDCCHPIGAHQKPAHSRHLCLEPDARPRARRHRAPRRFDRPRSRHSLSRRLQPRRQTIYIDRHLPPTSAFAAAKSRSTAICCCTRKSRRR